MPLPLLATFAVAVGAVAFLATLLGTLHTARWTPRSRVKPGPWRPRATVIVPCRGEHPGFDANVRALLRQDYPAYELLFVVDAKDDPSALALERLAGEEPLVQVLLAEPHHVGSGWATGKIVAQLTGVRHAEARSEVLVFADADVRPGPGWLAALVAPLAQPDVGGVTGYRWYTAASAPTVSTALRDAWNAVGLDVLTNARFCFLWGGSMAVRREDFARASIAEEWKRNVSEDVGLTRAVQRLGLRVVFAPQALVASPEDWSWPVCREWMARQTALTRASLPLVHGFAWLVYGASLALFPLGLLLLAQPDLALRLAGLGCFAPLLSAPPRLWLRQRMALAIVPGLAARPPRERALQLLASLAVPLLMMDALLAARRMEHIEWRGRRYALSGPPAAEGHQEQRAAP